MTREQLEHVVRAAAQIADDDELIVLGSQAVLGQFPEAPPAPLTSNEVDLAKLVAGREEDLAFAREAARHRLVSEEILRQRLSGTELSAQIGGVVEQRAASLFR